jgi:amino acid transporter
VGFTHAHTTFPHSHINQAAMSHLELEEEGPHGRHMGVTDVVMMIVQRIIGSGIFAVSSMIYRDVGGSPALFFLVWAIAGYSSYAGIMCFSELGSIIPKNGGLKVFLETIYDKPYMMINVVFGIFIVIFGSIIANVIIFGEYLLFAIGVRDEIMDAYHKPVGFLFLAIVALLLLVSTKFVVKLQTITGILKVILLLIVSLMGISVLVLPSSLTGIPNNLHPSDFFAIKTQVTISSFTSALLKAIFSFNGWHSTHTVMGEIKDPVRTMKIAAPLAILVINICYVLINLSYLIVIPSSELLELDEMVGLVLFEKLFGDSIGKIILCSLIAFSVGGNIITVLYHIARMNQEIFREGFLPFSKFMSSNYPFGTPIFAMLIPIVVTSFFLVVPTSSSVFNYAINLESYPTQVFFGLACLGIIILRRRNPDFVPGIKASMIDIAFMCLFSLTMVMGPLIKPDNSEFEGLPNYAYTSVGILLVCTAYWFFMFRLLPRLFKYDLVKQKLTLDDGMTITQWRHIQSAEDEGSGEYESI